MKHISKITALLLAMTICLTTLLPNLTVGMLADEFGVSDLGDEITELGEEPQTDQYTQNDATSEADVALLSAAETATTIASSECGANATWTLDSEGTLTISGTGDMTHYTVSSDTADTPWYEYAQSIETVIIEDGITLVGGNAFYNCSNLTSVTIPDSVLSICWGSFWNCTSLERITVPDSVKKLFWGAFCGCKSLKDLQLSSNIVNFATDSFRACTSLESVTVLQPNATFEENAIPSFITVYGYDESTAQTYAETTGNQFVSLGKAPDEEGTFGKSLTWTLTAKGVLTIGGTGDMPHYSWMDSQRAPWYGKRITTIVIEDTVNSIGAWAFDACSEVTSIVIPDNIKEIGSAAFTNCTSLSEITLSKNVGAFPYGTFMNTAFTTFEVPEHIWYIGSESFANCPSLTDVTILNSAADMQDNCIPANITIHGHDNSTAQAYAEANGNVFVSLDTKEVNDSCGENLTWTLDADGTLTISGTGEMTDYGYPNSDAPWYDNASSIKSVVISDGVTSIGGCAFYCCENLTSITIPESVTSIGWSAFQNCLSLTSVTIPNSVTSIGNYAFSGCWKLTSITIPESVTSIGLGAFQYCSSLTSINVDSANTKYKSIDGVLFTKDGTELHSYPAGKTDTSYIISDDVTTIDSYAFCGCRSFTTITIPESVTSIGWGAFEYCSSLTSVTIPNSVTSIGKYAFSGCSSLTSINVDSANTAYKSIDGILFTKDGAELVRYPAGKADISYIIPNSVTTIGQDAFFWCSSLTSVTIPESVTSIGFGAFQTCSKLTSITIPASVTNIGWSAFNNCDNLESIIIENAEATIDSDAIPTSTTIYGYVDSTAQAYATENGNEFVALDGEVASGTCGDDITWILENGVLTLTGTGAMYNYDYTSDSRPPWFGYTIDSVVVGDGITEIGVWAFGECTGITSVKLPDSVLVINTCAFAHCNKLVDINIPKYLTHIFWSAFKDTAISSFEIPKTVFYVGHYAFDDCPNLTKVTVRGFSTTLEDNAIVSTATVYGYEDSTAQAYVTTFGNKFVVLNETLSGRCGENITWTLENHVFTMVGSGNMYNYSYEPEKRPEWYGNDVRKIVIDDDITSIGTQAFAVFKKLKSLVIPDSVITIEAAAFADCTELESVTISENAVFIYWAAFSGCTSLKEVVIPASVTYFGGNVFYGCTALESIEILSSTMHIEPESIPSTTTIYGYTGSTAEKYATENGNEFVALDGEVASGICGENLTWKLTNDGTLTISGIGAMTDYPNNNYTPWYDNATSIKSVVIDDGVTSIGRYAFCACENLTSVTIPNGVTSIGDKAFLASSLAGITIPSSVTSIGGGAFSSCFTIKSIDVDTANTAYKSIDGVLFTKDGTELVRYPDGRFREYTIPDGVTSIGDDAFTNCPYLINVTIPDSVTSIGRNAFTLCNSLTHITIPESVTKIGYNAFYWCRNLTSINVDEANAAYKSTDGVLFTKDGTELICYPVGKTDTSYIIPDGVTSIGDCAFECCSKLTSITIPNGVTSIGWGAFASCSSLTSITIPDSVASIDDYAFWNCSKLTSITIPESVTNIGRYAFDYCENLESITIKNGYASIGEGAIPSTATIYGYTDSTAEEYADENGNKFESIGELSALTGTCGDNLTWELKKGVLTISGIGAMTDYTFDFIEWKVSAPWGDYVNAIESVVIEDGVTSIGDNAFAGCSDMVDITLPDTLITIGYDVFFYCNKLASITIPGSVNNIKSVTTFWEAAELANIYVDDSNENYKDIDGVLFSKDGTELLWFPTAKSVTTYTIPDGVTSIGYYSFVSCINLTDVIIPNTVTTIDSYAFCECISFTTITIPDSVTSIGERAFLYCENLESITIKNGHASIGEGAIPSTATIYGYTDSTAEEYATENGNEFVSLGKAYTVGDFTEDGTVTLDDAIYLLYYTFNPDGYPLNQPGDFNHDNNITLDDAIYLLYHTFNPTGYPLS